MSGVENMLEVLERYERDFGDGSRRASYDEDGDRKLEALRNTPEAPKSLPEALIEQLALLELDERQRRLAEYLIWSLDHRGWLDTPLEEIAAACGESDVRVEELEAGAGGPAPDDPPGPRRARPARVPALAARPRTTSTCRWCAR